MKPGIFASFPGALRKIADQTTNVLHTEPTTGSGIKQIIILFCVLEMLDAIITHLAVKAGLVWEGNPLIVNIAGDLNFLFLKGAGVILSGLVLFILYKHFRRLSLIAASSIAVFYGAVLAWNSRILINILLPM